MSAQLFALPPPSTMAMPSAPSPANGAVSGSVGGMMPAMSLQDMQDKERKDADARQSQPLITGLAAHITHKFTIARDAKRMEIEPRMLAALRARRGEYDPMKLAQIKAQGGSEVFAGLTSMKCRSAAGWIRDVMMSTGQDRPWVIYPTPLPELPVDLNELLVQQATAPLKQALMQGQQIDQMQVVAMLATLKEQATAAVLEEAKKRANLMADKMEDQLSEGGFYKALDEFIDDLTTFPSAIIAGPIIRMRPVLSWGPAGEPVVKQDLVKEWERVSPFDFYPSPDASCVDDGDTIRKHRLSRRDIQALRGVEGYDDAAIAMVLEAYGRGGLNNWLFDLSEQQSAEGKAQATAANNPDGLIDALQFHGSVSGQMLRDWGMDAKQVPDTTREYDVEAWQIGSYVIKAVLNPDPLCRKPYFAASYENIPGSFWGRSVADLVNDPQTIVNAVARAIVNNAALSSGPQVGILTDRLAPGEDVTQMTPWRIWQMVSDPLTGTPQPPIQFFQPVSNAQELMMLFEKFSDLADEYSGIPKYLSGETSGGAGRTASGLSMLIDNAGKSIKAVINSIDHGVLTPLLERLYYYNMRYEADPDLKGDVKIVARGATVLLAKQAAQVRRQEFLAATANPIDMQVVGVEGRATILREVAKGLDMNTDDIVPPVEVLRSRWAAQAALAAPQPGTPAAPNETGGTPPAVGSTENNGQKLMDGSPINDNF